MIGGYLILDDDRFTLDIDETEKIITDKQLADVLYNNDKPLFFKAPILNSIDLEDGTYFYTTFSGWLSKICSNLSDIPVRYVAQIGTGSLLLGIIGDTIHFNLVNGG